MSKEEAVNKVKQDGVDAVITIVLLKKEAVKNYYPGHPHYWPSNTYYQDFGRYYTTISILIREPDYYVVNTKYNWESNFYDLGSQDLVYSVQTQSFDPVSTEDLANEYGKMIVKNMFKMGIIEKQKKLKAF
jgi:hypothetical protein